MLRTSPSLSQIFRDTHGMQKMHAALHLLVLTWRDEDKWEAIAARSIVILCTLFCLHQYGSDDVIKHRAAVLLNTAAIKPGSHLTRICLAQGCLADQELYTCHP